MEKGYEILKERPDLKETALISLQDLDKIEIALEEFMKTPREIKCFIIPDIIFVLCMM